MMQKRCVFVKYGTVCRRNSLCMKIFVYHFILRCVIVYVSSVSLCAEERRDAEGAWIQLFNGKNLHGWTPKFAGYDLGINFRNTFVVRDGLLTICYDNYKGRQNSIGHLFYKDEFSHYVLRVEYRFARTQVKDTPESLLLHSGLMIHGQSAESMGKDQKRPDSVEAKLLSQHRNPAKKHRNLSVDTLVANTKPDVHSNEVVDKQQQEHQWTCVEIEVYGGEVIRHKSGGQLIMEYKKPSLSDGSPLVRGTIALQANSHPIQFRKIELKVLNH